MEKVSKGKNIRIEIFSRRNSINGKYKICKIGLDNLSKIDDNDISFLEALKMKADLADKMISEAELQGKDTSDPRIMEKLGEEINSAITPLHRSESIMTAIFVSLQIILYYGIALGIWGLVFKKGFLIFSIYGIIAGFLISLLSIVPAIAFQITKEKTKDMVFGVSSLWGNLGIIIGVLGLVSWGIKSLFF